MDEVDWDKGLPLDLLSKVAGGQNALKAMRGVSRTWKAGFESSTSKVKLGCKGAVLPRGGAFALRFPAVRALDVSDSLTARKHAAGILGRVVGAGITSLILRGCDSLTDYEMDLLGELPLTRLDLSGCSQITDVGLQFLHGLLLEDLDLGGCRRLTPAGLAHLRGMPLRRLVLSKCCNIFGSPAPEELAPLAAMPLTDLDLAWSCLSDAGLAALRGLPLTRLSLYFCIRLSDAGLEALEGMPLRVLNLTVVSNLTGAGLRALRCASLTDLNLTGCFKVTDAGLEALRGLPLKNLSLSGCPLDFDPSLGPLHGMPITDLSLGNTGWVSVDAVGRCFDCLETLPLTHLTILNVNAYLTEVILATRLQNFPLLTQLIVVSCQGVSEAGIVFLKQNLPHIQVMHIKYALDQSLIL